MRTWSGASCSDDDAQHAPRQFTHLPKRRQPQKRQNSLARRKTSRCGPRCIRGLCLAASAVLTTLILLPVAAQFGPTAAGQWIAFAAALGVCHEAPLKVSRSVSSGGWRLFNKNRSLVVHATVPGSAHTALIAAGILGDPYYRNNELSYRWVAEESQWLWRHSFRPLSQCGGSGICGCSRGCCQARPRRCRHLRNGDAQRSQTRHDLECFCDAFIWTPSGTARAGGQYASGGHRRAQG